MTRAPSYVFAASYLVGTAVGVLAGLTFPWWLSGGPAWVLPIAAIVWRPLGPTWRELEAALRGINPVVIGLRLMRLEAEHDDRVAAMAWGLSSGALAGAAGCVASLLLDWLTWPGHDPVLGPCVAGLVALAWAVGTACEEDDAPFSPVACGLGLYAVVVAMSVLPALLEVL